MSKILLDYFFPIATIEPTPAASTAFLKQVAIVVKPKGGVTTGVATLCTSISAVNALTDNAEAQQLFNAGMNRVYVIPMDDLNLVQAMTSYGSQFFTLLISGDFTDADIVATQASLTKAEMTFTAVTEGFGGNDISIIFEDSATAGAETVSVDGKEITVGIEGGVSTAAQIKAALDADDDAAALITASIASGEESTAQAAFVEDNLEDGDGLDVGAFGGVVGISSADDDMLAEYAPKTNYAPFHTTSGNKAKNMFYAFGKLLSNSLSWKNQQFISMPVADDVDELGEAENLFTEKINFTISDDEFGDRLGLFAVGGKAIIAPYVKRNLEIDLQSAALSYISGNQPAYSVTQAALVEDELQKVVDSYIDREWIESGEAEVKLEQANFVASGYMEISEPNALWRIFGQITQTT